MNWIRKNAWCFAAVACLIFAVGCNPSTDTPGDDPEPAAGGDDGHDHGDEAAHSHTEGPNGGPLAVLGGHQYHAEVLADEASGAVDVLITDPDFKPIAIDAKELALNLMIDKKPSSYVFRPAEAVEGEPAKFSLTDPELAELIADVAWEGDARVSIEIGGTPYSETLARPEKEEGHVHGPDCDHGDADANHEEGAGHDADADHDHDAHEGEGHDDDAAPVEPIDHDGHDHAVEVTEPVADPAPEEIEEAHSHEGHGHEGHSH